MSSPPTDPKPVKRTGPLAWMANNVVAANLMMAVFLIGGFLMAGRVKQEVFPEVALDMITVTVAYPGASPAEVEQGVILAIEEAVRGIDGVREVLSTASEGVGIVTLELLLSADKDNVLSDVRSAVDRITLFPEDAERPVIGIVSNRNQVISLILYGDLPETTLRDLANRARDDLLNDEHVTLVTIGGVRPLEISVEVSREALRNYGLTHDDIARVVSQGNIELPAGDIRTSDRDVAVRTTERRLSGEEYENLVLLSRPDGTIVRLGEVARVVDGFRDTGQEAFFNGQRAVMVNVFRVGDQTPIEVAQAVKEYMDDQRELLPENVQLSIWNDSSEIYQDRINLLLRNGYIGLTLVLLVLGLFLEIRLAFWVTMGIPISFLGGVLLMPAMDVSLNMISLFAFILTLGIVVDDAIVVGEAVYHKRRLGYSRLSAAILGVREVAQPVIFAVLTSCMAFMPLFFVPGAQGKLFGVVPAIVIAVLLLSLVESLLILPAHLAHSKKPAARGVMGWIHHRQESFSHGVERFIDKIYRPSVRAAIRGRYLTVGVGVAILVLTVGFVLGGGLQTSFMPNIETDVITARLTMPVGTAVEETNRVAADLTRSAREVFEELGGEPRLSRGIFTQVGEMPGELFGPEAGMGGTTGGHLAQVMIFLVPSAQRDFGASDFTRVWRERLGEVKGAESLGFNYAIRSSGAPIDIELSHSQVPVLEAAAARLAESLSGYAGVTDIDNGFSPGKEQLDVELAAEGRTLGITETDLARQLRAAFFGAEAVRQLRERDELRVYVRLPEEQRASEHDFEELLLRAPEGGEIPLAEAARVQRGRAYTQIRRANGRRVLNVTADVDTDLTNANNVMANLESDVLPDLLADTPGLTWGLGGEQEQQRESLQALGLGFLFALLCMFGLMAVAFRSYIQPVVIMAAIPFGMVGAVIGHVIMGYDLSLVSAMGIVALSGIVVNDSLILIAAVNAYRDEGMTPLEALEEGGVRRFRPIILTSLTTFFGLAPMIFETSLQARFLIPMAVSLGFGVLFGTIVILMLVPALYGIIEDVRASRARFRAFMAGPQRAESSSQPIGGGE